MPVVVDASVALSLFLEDEKYNFGADMLTLIKEEAAFVPPIFWLEIANALLVNEKRGRIQSETTRQLFSDLRQLPVVTVECPIDHDIIALARSQGITIYDATYLQVALEKRANLLTLDGDLATAADSVDLIVSA